MTSSLRTSTDDVSNIRTVTLTSTNNLNTVTTNLEEFKDNIPSTINIESKTSILPEILIDFKTDSTLVSGSVMSSNKPDIKINHDESTTFQTVVDTVLNSMDSSSSSQSIALIDILDRTTKTFNDQIISTREQTNELSTIHDKITTSFTPIPQSTNIRDASALSTPSMISLSSTHILTESSTYTSTILTNTDQSSILISSLFGSISPIADATMSTNIESSSSQKNTVLSTESDSTSINSFTINLSTSSAATTLLQTIVASSISSTLKTLFNDDISTIQITSSTQSSLLTTNSSISAIATLSPSGANTDTNNFVEEVSSESNTQSSQNNFETTTSTLKIFFDRSTPFTSSQSINLHSTVYNDHSKDISEQITFFTTLSSISAIEISTSSVPNIISTANDLSTSKSFTTTTTDLLSSVVNLERTTEPYTNQDTKSSFKLPKDAITHTELSSTERTTLSDKIDVLSSSISSPTDSRSALIQSSTSDQVNNKLITTTELPISDTVGKISTNTLKSSDLFDLQTTISKLNTETTTVYTTSTSTNSLTINLSTSSAATSPLQTTVVSSISSTSETLFKNDMSTIQSTPSTQSSLSTTNSSNSAIVTLSQSEANTDTTTAHVINSISSSISNNFVDRSSQNNFETTTSTLEISFDHSKDILEQITSSTTLSSLLAVEISTSIVPNTIHTANDLSTSENLLSFISNLEKTTDLYTNQDTVSSAQLSKDAITHIQLSSTETTTLSDKIDIISSSTSPPIDSPSVLMQSSSSEQVNNKLITIPDTVDKISTNTLKSSDHFSSLSNTTITTTDSKTTDKLTYYQTETSPSILIASTEILNITSVAP
ncbi:unnamed protein product [Adineta steineri]|uniref:Uncharacterized protein n=1 Tax=Adineta steineri TaxID=433720 RepID=A0A820AL61_9BILA|nr:unnamed protein product [Adineta steineri]